jgi:hypothetical protein
MVEYTLGANKDEEFVSIRLSAFNVPVLFLQTCGVRFCLVMQLNE